VGPPRGRPQEDRRAGAPSDGWTLRRRPRHAGFVYAELPRRALASLIDLVLASAITAIVAQVAALVVRGPTFSRDLNELNVVALLYVALVSVLPTAVFAYLWHEGRAPPGHALVGFLVVHRTTGAPLSASAAFARWVLLYAPLALVAFPLVVGVVYDPSPFLILIELPWLPFIGAALPFAWYGLLGLSTLQDRRRGRGWHDRMCGSVVVRMVR
jgi:hypothetical protein